jgi:perosamine synthetase
VFTLDKKIGKRLRAFSDSLGQDVLLSDFNASVGIAQVKDIGRYVSRRKEIYLMYRAACMKSTSKTLSAGPEDETPFFSFPVILNSSMNDVRKYARKHDLDTLPAFLDSILARHIELEEHYPNAKNLLLRCLLFPLYPMLSSSHVNLVARVLSTLP